MGNYRQYHTTQTILTLKNQKITLQKNKTIEIMRKIFIYSLCMCALFTFNSFAMNVTSTSNFFIDNSKANVITVKQALKSSDKTPVVLEGYIVKQVDDDEFYFKDNTSQVLISIDEEIIMQFANTQITPNTLLRIHGSIDKELMEETKVDVFKLEIISNK